jgi:hypothetical protein
LNKIRRTGFVEPSYADVQILQIVPTIEFINNLTNRNNKLEKVPNSTLTDVEYSELDYDGDGEGKLLTNAKANTRRGKK